MKAKGRLLVWEHKDFVKDSSMPYVASSKTWFGLLIISEPIQVVHKLVGNSADDVYATAMSWLKQIKEGWEKTIIDGTYSEYDLEIPKENAENEDIVASEGALARLLRAPEKTTSEVVARFTAMRDNADLEDAIKHAREVSAACAMDVSTAECAKEHDRLAGWLEELRMLRSCLKIR